MTRSVRAAPPIAVDWSSDGDAVEILDQTRLPEAEVRIRLRTIPELVEAIAVLRVRGAPAIGVTAALGLAVVMARQARAPADVFRAELEDAADELRAARPTAVNLAWAVDRMLAAAATRNDPAAIALRLQVEADTILAEDREMCRRIGEYGLSLFPDGDVSMLTVCNAGALATAGIGTALAPVYTAHAAGRHVAVFAPETRPLLQGSRITAWELSRAGIDVTVLPDSAAALLLRDRRVDLVMVGADRIAANGDVANKVGTYALAVLASHHAVPFYVAAPASTLDGDAPTGSEIPIEHRDADEVRRGFGRPTAPARVSVYAPAFDVTPHALITAIVTDRGVLRPPFAPAIASIVQGEQR
ncbi:MAG: S-methyl-5-thioribose-1-phosphate isomerase [Gemmatimonadota bacterium]|jgi:methylthioribose-1-phosphate isomerase